MMKKILTAVLVTFASTGVMAKPDNAKMLGVNSKEISPWAIEAPAAPDQFPVGYAFITPEKQKTVIFFVNKFRASNPRVHSDPILLNCSNVPTIINPGKSAVCVIGPSDTEKGWASWSLAQGFIQNGSDGYTITLD